MNRFSNLSKPIKFTSFAYVGCLILYNSFCAYGDAKNELIAYRTDKLEKDKDINSEWEAVKCGASKNFPRRFFNSMIWPVTMCSDIVPFIVLRLNPNTDKKDE